MTHPKVLLSVLLTVWAIVVNAQKNFQAAYYISNSNDTIYGQIDNRGDTRNCRICNYRTEADGEVVQFAPGDIAAYRFMDGKYYISIELEINNEVQAVFIEYLVNGISSLYYYRSDRSDHYFIGNSDGELRELTNEDIEFEQDGKLYKKNSNRFIGQLKTTFSDAPEMQAKLEKAQFQHKSLINLTSEYHDYVCDGEQCIIYEKPPPLLRINVGPVVGFSSSGLKFIYFPNYDEYKYMRSSDIILGLKLNILLPRLNEKLSFIIQTEYSTSYFYGYKENNLNSASTIYMDLHAHLTNIKGLFGLQYTYPKGKIRPTVVAGPLLDFNLKSDFKLVNETVIDSNVFTRETYENLFQDESYGAFFSIGFDWNLVGRQHIGLDLRYHYTKETFATIVRKDGLTLMLGYYF